MKTGNAFIFLLVALFVHSSVAWGSTTQMRMDQDIAAEKPIVIQVSVALADNKHQWIVPVPTSIGNGQDARTNLYWGARYGVKTFMIKDGGWKKVRSSRPDDKRILERLVLKKVFSRNGKRITVYLVADAWDGKYIRETIKQFLNYTAGQDVFKVQVNDERISAGGAAHLIVYIGHNALMDYVGAKNLTISNPKVASTKPENDAIVLACKSEPYFLPRLNTSGTFPLVLTTGLMAPEAYSLNAAIKPWVAGKNPNQVKKAAAAGYHQYQKCGRKAAERLFGAR